MTSAQQQATLAASNCEIAFDNLTRQLYATDASIYQIEPLAVAFPRGARQASALVQAAAQAGVSVIPRGAGTGLVGGAIGDGLVLDLARHNRQISELDRERRTVRVGSGVVLDQLNAHLRPHGFWFGPDVATSSRATLGGMIANNSSGAHAPAYGTTADHIVELEVVLADGQVVTVGPGRDTLRRQRELVEDLVCLHGLEIQERMPPGLRKRWPGYGINGCLREPGNLNYILCGSEGTLALITSAVLRIVPLPASRGVGLLFFDSVGEALRAAVELLDFHPAAVEHLDRLLLDQTKGQREFQAARDLLELDQKPAEAVLVVEFFEDVEARLQGMARRDLGLRTLLLRTPAEANLVWALRKAGLSLLTGRKGVAKPVTCIEDAAVLPERLPEYVAGLESLMKRLGLEASYYGHAAAGLLHVRPVLDLRSGGDLKRFRHLADEVSNLVRHFNGSLTGEHGAGIARTEYLAQHLGDGLTGVMRQLKAAFDPYSLFNPGKVVPDGRFEIDANLRLGLNYNLELPFQPVLAFAAKDGSFVRNLEQCNGCGGCLKQAPAMCPTFIATGDEGMSTRGRVNTIRAVLERRGGSNGEVLRAPELEYALTNCLGCKACTVECPSNVNMTLLKTELVHAQVKRYGLSVKQRVFSAVDLLGALGCRAPRLMNWALGSALVQGILAKLLGLAPQRPLPQYTRERFDRWHHRHKGPDAAPRGRVLLWDDTFVRYHEPHIGRAAVKVLEAAGFEVVLPVGRKCCGRPAFSQGNLDRVRKLGAHNLALLNQQAEPLPVLFLEPSCFSMFVQDYLELALPGAEQVATRCFLFEQFIDELLLREPDALRFSAKPAKVVIHAHCHVKSLMSPSFLRRLAGRLPQREVSLLDTGCCGMAGAFGMMESQYDLSLRIAEPLLREVRAQPYGTWVLASGTSCRHQIGQFAPVRPRHVAEALAEALA